MLMYASVIVIVVAVARMPNPTWHLSDSGGTFCKGRREIYLSGRASACDEGEEHADARDGDEEESDDKVAVEAVEEEESVADAVDVVSGP